MTFCADIQWRDDIMRFPIRDPQCGSWAGMRRRLPRTTGAPLLILGAAVCASLLSPTRSPAAGVEAGEEGRHLHLVRSDPAAGDTLRVAPAAVRLWFSQAPELAVTTIHLNTATGAAVALAAATQDTAADAPVTAALRAPAPAGAYVVSWRTTARDGHPASGRYQFVIAAAARVARGD
jgi:methionine-rich copper-binding protein CopC